MTYYHIQHRRELGENQDFVTPLKQSIEQPLQQQHFAACVDQVIVDDKIPSILIAGPIEEERMTRNLLIQLRVNGYIARHLRIQKLTFLSCMIIFCSFMLLTVLSENRRWVEVSSDPSD